MEPAPMSIAHRMRCVTVKVGVVNTCPVCGRHVVADFHWDFRRDPARGWPISLDLESDDLIAALRDIAPSTAVPCEGCS